MACASLRAPLTCPADGGPPWVEASSAHFTLRSDLPEPEAKETLAAVEAAYVMFKDVAFPSHEDPHDHLEVVAFAREKDYRAVAPAGSGAYFTPQLPGDLEVVPTLVMRGRLDEDNRRVLQHELAHFFTRQGLGAVPVWFSEGTAGYYETLRAADGWVWFGMPRADRRVHTGSRLRSTFGDVLWVPVGYLPTVPALVHMDRETFSAMDNADSPASQRARLTNYMGAWGLIHLFHEGPEEYRKRYVALSARLNAGTPFALAWKATFGDLHAVDLEHAYRAHLSTRITMHPVPYQPRPAPPVGAARPLTPAEVHTLWARLARWKGKNAERVREHLGAAAAHDPSSPEVSFLRGLHAIRIDEDAETAVTMMEQAYAARPGDARVLLGLALALELREERRSRGFFAPSERLRKDGRARLAEVVTALSRAATTATELGYLASREARLGHRDAALALALRAVKADPNHAASLELYAALAADKGDLAEAVSAQERAVAVLDDQRAARPLLRTLADYIRRYQKTQQPSEPPPGEPTPSEPAPSEPPKPPAPSRWETEP
jgi:hypothetical protein